VREQESKRRHHKRATGRSASGLTEKAAPKEEDKKQQALDLIIETIKALSTERGEEEKIWGSMVKQALKRRNPGFNEAYYGFRSFGKLLEEAQGRRLLELERDEKSGGYIIKSVVRED
ncbi:MAG: OST-HTH/LOTUS domain-containing protein, partial [Nitrososphaera sp.]|nr:OST-HTH/LOTUS domain-containing protein [Nitrososphaera sp.]